MFEVKTYEELLQECMDNAPEGIDTRQGSIFYDACAAKCLVLAEAYADLGMLQDMCHVNTATGEDLDACGLDHGVVRQEAVAMKCRGVFEGAVPSVGSRFFIDGIFFVMKNNLNELYPDNEELIEESLEYLEAEISGTQANRVGEGDVLTPYNDIPGLATAKIGEIIVSGSEEESDESYRERIQNKIGGPAENGNKYHYKTWCESRPGVGEARIFTLANIENDEIVYNVPNFVSAVLLKADGTPVDEVVVKDVQEYIDPDSEGLGEGVANAGAHFVATAAKSFKLYINIDDVELSDKNYTETDVVSELVPLIGEYLSELALSPIVFNGTRAEKIAIRIKKIGAIVSNAETIADYGSLSIRLETGEFAGENIYIDPNCVAMLASQDDIIPGIAVVLKEDTGEE